MSLRLLAAPFHDGVPELDRGRGPLRLLEAATASGVLKELGSPVVETIEPPDPAAPEAARVFGIGGRIAELVRAAIVAGDFPLVLAGDCNSSFGTVAGCGSEGLGVVWFDAHADFDTPEDSVSGSLDAMGLAIVAGEAWPSLARTAVGLAPVDESRVLIVAVRDLEPAQRRRLDHSGIRVLAGNSFTSAELGSALDELRHRATRAYLHVDLDALDPSEGVANQFSAPGGLSAPQLVGAIDDVFDRFEVAAAAITAYNPDSDLDGRMAGTAMTVLDAIARRACVAQSSNS